MSSIDAQKFTGSQIDNVQPIQQTITSTINSNSFSTISAASGYFSTLLKVNGSDVITSSSLPQNLVDTSSVQTLTNKDLSSATNSFPTSLVTLTGTQVISNKDLTSATNSFPTSLATLTGSQTLSNKIIQFVDGNAASPSLSFSDSGLFRIGTNTIGISTGGTQRVSVSDTLVTSTLNIRAPTGAFNTPSYSFSTNTGSGIYDAGSNRLGVVANSTPVMTLSSTQVLCNQQLTVQNGNFSAPGMNFYSDTSSGWLRNASGDFRFAVASSSALGVQANGIYLYGSTASPNTSYTASKLGYYQEETQTPVTLNFGTNTNSTTFRITRIGNVVHLSMDADCAQTSSGSINSITTSAFINSQYRPTSTRKVLGYITVIDVSGTKYNDWFLQVNTDGTMQWSRYNTALSGSFTIYSFSASWMIAP